MPYTEDGYIQGDGWVAGIDFDPSDPDEMDVMRHVWEQERHDRLQVLERENDSLRTALYDKMTDDERATVDR